LKLKEEVSMVKMNAFRLAATCILLGLSCSITTTTAKEANRDPIDFFNLLLENDDGAAENLEQEINYKKPGVYLAGAFTKTTCYNVNNWTNSTYSL